jgi:hypothetical protein
MKKKWIFILAPLAILGFVAFIAIGGEIVRLLWNWLLPPLFGWREITFWQGLGLLALCRILFGGFRLNGGGGSGGGRPGDFRRHRLDRLADRVGERFDAMTPEERERFRERLRDRCGFGPAASESKE